MDEREKQDLAAAVATGVTSALERRSVNEVEFAKLKKDVEQLQKEFEVIWKWKSENESVLLWARNFMDTYRRTVGAVLVSGAITLIGLLIQLYYTMGKGR